MLLGVQRSKTFYIYIYMGYICMHKSVPAWDNSLGHGSRSWK